MRFVGTTEISRNQLEVKLSKRKMFLRRFATKVNVKLVAQLRKETECSMSKAKDALVKHENDYQKALHEIQHSLVNTKKLASRATTEGLVCAYSHPIGVHSAVVELNSETDFVAKSPSFVELIERIATTAALLETGNGSRVIKKLDIEILLQKSLVGDNKSVSEGIASVIGKLKENIQLRRGIVFHDDGTGLISGSYAHGVSTQRGVGRVASIIVLKSPKNDEMVRFAQKLAQHVAGFAPKSIHPAQGIEDEFVLMNQPYLFGGGPVVQVISALEQQHGPIEIIDFERLECGEGIERKVDDFAQQVMSQIKK
jgi:elongation factor Ts